MYVLFYDIKLMELASNGYVSNNKFHSPSFGFFLTKKIKNCILVYLINYNLEFKQFVDF